MVAHVGGSCGVRFSSLFVCLFSRRYTVSQKPMRLGLLNLTQTCSTTSPGNPFNLGSKGQRAKSRGTKNSALAWDFALLRVLASSSVGYSLNSFQRNWRK